MRSLLVFFAVLAGCASVHGPGAATPESTPDAVEPASDVPARDGAPEHGVASYYGKKLAGHKTASGERYDPAKLTAAHRTLPFGTIALVSRSDGRSVRVRINDRGPFVTGRVIDLSRSAAQEIGLLKDGVADVTVTVVSRPDDDQ